MTAQKTGGGSFHARRDNRGAFATGAGAYAHNVEHCGIYIENYRGPTPAAALLQSYVPKELEHIIINGYKYEITTVDVALVEARIHVEARQDPSGVIKSHQLLHLFFRTSDGRVFDYLWPNAVFQVR